MNSVAVNGQGKTHNERNEIRIKWKTSMKSEQKRRTNGDKNKLTQTLQ